MLHMIRQASPRHPAAALLLDYIRREHGSVTAFCEKRNVDRLRVQNILHGKRKSVMRDIALSIERATDGAVPAASWGPGAVVDVPLLTFVRPLPTGRSTLVAAFASDGAPLKVSPWSGEQELCDRILAFAIKHDIECQWQVTCNIGIADLVDSEYVYELKGRANSFFTALGQAIAYGKSLDRKPCMILGSELAASRASVAEEVGVKVLIVQWATEGLAPSVDFGGFDSPGAQQWAAWLSGPPPRLQTQVAKELGFAQQTISQWSRGLVPSLENRLRIYKATGIDPSAWLTNGARDAEEKLLKDFGRGKGKRSVAA